ncbi:MAG: uracil-xanthine permease family protein [Anaerovoracaceae bacterium]
MLNGNENKKTVEATNNGVHREEPIYHLDDRPPFAKLVIYSMQFVIIFIGSIVLVPVIVAGPLSWDGEMVTFILQCAIFTGGIATFVQVKGFGPVGARLPILLGTTFVIINPLIAITLEYGYDAFLGAVIAGGIIYAIFGYFGFKILYKIFGGVVSGTLIVAIAMTLALACADMMAGGGNPVGKGYGSWENWMLAIITLTVCLLSHFLGKSFIKTASLFFGLATGYLIALAMDFIDFSNIVSSGWFSIPKPFAFGVSFHLQPILIMVVIYIVTIVEFIGDTTATAMVCEDRLPTQKELRGGILCDALSSVFSGIFNFAPNISYSDGIGIIGTTRVASRAVMIGSAFIITIAGLIPKFAAALYTVPASVLGGATMFLTGIMLIAGIEVILTQPLNLRNSVIVGTSLAVGIGFGFSGVFEGAPIIINTLLSGIPGTALVGGFLNIVLPREK